MRDGVGIYGEWLFWIDDDLVYRGNNLVVQQGLNFLSDLLVGTRPADVPIHLAMGTDGRAPALTDTGLFAEELRKPISAKSPENNIVRIRTFFLPTEANGNWYEFGLFFSGTDMPNSGEMFNRITPPGGISKTDNQVLSVEARIKFMPGGGN